MRRSIPTARHAAAALIALTAACSDSPTAPASASAAAPTAAPSASVMRMPPRIATFQVSSKIPGMVIPRTTVEFIWNGGKLWVTDNGANDTDPTVGRFKVALPASTYYTAKPFQVLDDAWWLKPAHVTNAGVLVGTTAVEFGVQHLKSLPAFKILAKTQYGQSLAGASFHVKGPEGSGLNGYPTDNGLPGYESSFDGPIAADGKIAWVVTKPGTWTVCETKAPTGYALPQPACRLVEMKEDQLSTMEFVHATPIIAPAPSY